MFWDGRKMGIYVDMRKPRLIPHECESEPGCKICRDYVNKLDESRFRKFSIPVPHYIQTNGNTGGINYILIN